MTSWEIQDLGGLGRCWLNPHGSELAVVFVHGFQGDYLATWTHKPFLGAIRKKKPVVLFDLLADDPALVPCDFYSLRHQGGISSPTDIEDAARILATLMDTYIPTDRPVALIAHSFGGLACRQAILNILKHQQDSFRILGLMMYGTPNSGTEIARVGKTLWSGAGSDMRPFDQALERLNRAWAARIVNGGNPDADPTGRASLICRFVAGTEDKVVPRASATAYASFASVETLPCGHAALVKPRDRVDPRYVMLAQFLSDVKNASLRRTGEAALKSLTYRLRKVTLKGRWVGREVEYIRLEKTDEPQWLRCTVRNRRFAGLTSSNFRLCVYLDGFRPQDSEIDFNWEIGAGNLTEEEFAALAQRMQDDPQSLFALSRLRVRPKGDWLEYEESEVEIGQGFVTYHFTAPTFEQEGRPYEELDLEFTSRVNRAQGWYTYQLSRTVAEHLEVVFVAPFEARPINFLSKGADFNSPTPQGELYLHKVTVDSALPIGRSVTWVFPGSQE